MSQCPTPDDPAVTLLTKRARCKVTFQPCQAAKHPEDTSTCLSTVQAKSADCAGPWVECLLSSAMPAPDPALSLRSEAPTGTNTDCQVLTSSNPTDTGSDFLSFCPFPLLSSTASKQRS